MPKNLTLMQVTALVPTGKVHEACAWLEDNGATSMMVRAYRNGATPPPKKGQAKTPNGNVEQGENQQDWLRTHINPKAEFKATDLKEMWVSSGYPDGSIYSALARAVRDKLLKKVKPGTYRRVG